MSSVLYPNGVEYDMADVYMNCVLCHKRAFSCKRRDHPINHPLPKGWSAGAGRDRSVWCDTCTPVCMEAMKLKFVD
jgi:hypothetical protein